MKRALIVGAGAVGQVYAAALERAGVDVTFYVRPKYREAVERGLRVVRLRMGGRREPYVLGSPRVMSSVEEAASTTFDAVWLCIPSNGVHEAGTTALLEALTGTLLVSLTPGLDDRARLATVVEEASLVTGHIPFLAWFEDGELGEEVVLFVPPLSASLFEGARAAEVVSTLRRGGMDARVEPKLGRIAPFGTAVLMPLVAELETAGWRFAALDAAHRRRFRQASGEALRVVSAETRAAPPLGLRLLRRVVHPWALAVANALSPFDLEGFFRRHFVKVGAQTSRTLAVYADKATEHGVGPVPALEALRSARDALPAESGSRS